MTIGNTVFQYYITDISQNAPKTTTTLDDTLNAKIDTYFDKITGLPTPFAIGQFNSYTTELAPMDMFHKNKLRDVVYYFMENIIPGLPPAKSTAGAVQSSNTYVEWKPIKWLSHSDI